MHQHIPMNVSKPVNAIREAQKKDIFKLFMIPPKNRVLNRIEQIKLHSYTSALLRNIKASSMSF